MFATGQSQMPVVRVTTTDWTPATVASATPMMKLVVAVAPGIMVVHCSVQHPTVLPMAPHVTGYSGPGRVVFEHARKLRPAPASPVKPATVPVGSGTKRNPRESQLLLALVGVKMVDVKELVCVVVGTPVPTCCSCDELMVGMYVL